MIVNMPYSMHVNSEQLAVISDETYQNFADQLTKAAADGSSAWITLKAGQEVTQFFWTPGVPVHFKSVAIDG